MLALADLEMFELQLLLINVCSACTVGVDKIVVVAIVDVDKENFVGSWPVKACISLLIVVSSKMGSVT